MKNFFFFILLSVYFFYLNDRLAFGEKILYTDFSNLSGFTINGDAATLNDPSALYNGQSVLRLAEAKFFADGQKSSAYLTSLVTLKTQNDILSFHSHFKFIISQSGGVDGGADGLAFVIQGQGSNALGEAGLFLGCSNINPSLFVEFDTYDNPGASPPDGGSNHVGININGNMNSLTSTPVTPNFNNGNVWNSWIDYDALTHNLEVRISQNDNRPLESILSYNIDLLQLLGRNDAWFGFSAGTGSGYGFHDIVSWELETVPEPTMFSLLVLGGLGMIRRGK